MPGYVLVIDDDRTFTELVCHALKSDGYHAVAASTAQQALSLVSLCRPQLILLDLVMPAIRGEHFFGILHSQPDTATIPIIIVSASMTDRQAEEMAALGAVATVMKARFSMPEFRSLVKKWMDRDTASAA
jgi:CheY-like chemotaxis protein